jgi:chromate reductase, NAD(P)H dehydrogenase (quinone)
MQILAVSGSLQRTSGNLALLHVAAALAPVGVEVQGFDGLRALPHFDPDLDTAVPPPPVDAWRAALRRSDAVMIACPEYGHSLPGSLKNAIDWVIGSGELYRKVVAITAAVPSPERGRLGLNALRQTLQAVDATIVGGTPIVRGPQLESEVSALLMALIEASALTDRP